jgi:hypothetical protein
VTKNIAKQKAKTGKTSDEQMSKQDGGRTELGTVSKVARFSAVSPACEVRSANPLDAYDLLQIVGKGAFGKVFKVSL